MPDAATTFLLGLFGVALGCFGGGLYLLAQRGDLLSLVLFAAGALALRALSQAAKIVEGGSG